MEHQPPVTQEKMKTYQLSSRKNVEVARGTVRVDNPIPAKLPKKTFQKTATTKKLKKIRGSKLCSKSSKVNEQLNQKEAEEVPETVEAPVCPPTQSQPEEVPETVETPAILAGPVDSQ